MLPGEMETLPPGQRKVAPGSFGELNLPQTTPAL